MPLQVGARLGPYEILALIGAGGMGEVYRARDTKLNRDVAIKVLPESVATDPERLARFHREAQVLASLNHPNIAHIYGVEDSSSTHALVMELVEGPTLADRIALGPIPIAEALPLAKQIAEALESAHERGIIHRDLKPANIKVRDDGTVKVLDFGLAKLVDPAAASVSSVNINVTASPTITSPALMTSAGVILGTAAYMSPEQAKGRPADRRSDLWAFGCVLYEMLTGARAFPGEEFAETFAAVVRGEPEWTALPPDTPSAIRQLLRRCLQKEPRRRLQVAGDARIEIDEALNEPEPAPATAMPVQPLPQGRWRERLAWLLAGTLALAVVALAWMYAHPRAMSTPSLFLSIGLPSENDDVRAVALSPDGRTVAMAAQINSRYQLWLRSMDDGEFRPLDGTNLARVPFWSPDSRSIGFFADSKLKVVSATGGPALALCDSGTGGGGTWNRDGTILFARAQPGPIYKVRATGGDCTPVTHPEPASGHSFPEFLPDGQHFFYVVTRGEEAKRGVYVASLDQPNGHRVLGDQSSVNYLAPRPGQPVGRLIFLRNDTLMAQPFDIGTLQTSGDPAVVATHASRSNTAPQMAAAANDTGALLYISNSAVSQGANLQLAWIDRSGKELQTIGESTGTSAVALSPDDRSAAIAIREPDGVTAGLWLRDLERQTISRFTSPNNSSTAPVWSPDGQRIVFSGIRSGSAVADLYIKDKGGADERLLWRTPYAKAASDWSRDGKYLVYTEINPKTGADIWMLPNPSGPSTEFKPVPFANSQFLESQGQLSPDGRWIAYVSDESGQYEVYVRPFPSGEGKWRVSTASGREPRWRGDGRELFYEEGLLGRLRVMAVTVTPGSGPAAGLTFGAPALMFEFRTSTILPQNNQFSYAPTRDGQRFLFHRLSGDVRPILNVLLNWQDLRRR